MAQAGSLVFLQHCSCWWLSAQGLLCCWRVKRKWQPNHVVSMVSLLESHSCPTYDAFTMLQNASTSLSWRLFQRNVSFWNMTRIRLWIIICPAFVHCTVLQLISKAQSALSWVQKLLWHFAMQTLHTFPVNKMVMSAWMLGFYCHHLFCAFSKTQFDFEYCCISYECDSHLQPAELFSMSYQLGIECRIWEIETYLWAICATSHSPSSTCLCAGM